MNARVCIVNPYEHGGGAEYQIDLIIDRLAASGRYDISHLAHFVDRPDRARKYRSVRIGSGGGVPRLGYLMDAPALYRELRRVDPCLIYQRVACAYTGICAAYARRRSIPLVWHVAHDTDVSPEVLDPGRNLARVRLEKWAVNFGARHATRIIVQTERQAQLLQRNFARTADAVVPNFHPPAAEIIDKSGPMTVLWIANLKLWKRPDAFVRLARSFEESPEVRFVMVGAPSAGSGRHGWQESLMRVIEATPNLAYLGGKTQNEVNELLARAHVLVNTSTHEGFPNTFIQAWLRDAAVVSLDVDPDGVLERKGVGIAARSEPGLTAAVRRLIEDPEARAGFVKRGREHAAANHSLRNVERLVGLLGGYSGGG
ncbi:MAG TPA: glycosyltransferase [Steroidobacteraceae bacterium]|jgi:glycosyltransferase involved in cell wall biosynthesis|nr:glycosyltransferase [Steroidobacteraceae bacterium]